MVCLRGGDHTVGEIGEVHYHVHGPLNDFHSQGRSDNGDGGYSCREL